MTNKKFIIEGFSFIIATILFLLSIDYLFENLDINPITLRGFLALEYVLFYAYTIYDHIKNIKKDGSI